MSPHGLSVSLRYEMGRRCELVCANGQLQPDGTCVCVDGFSGLRCEHDCTGGASQTIHCFNAGTCDADADAKINPTCECLGEGPHSQHWAGGEGAGRSSR